MKICNKSDHWSRFDRKIRDAEAEELKRLNASEETLEAYFDERHRQRLNRMKISEMSFQDIDILENLKKASENEYPEPEDTQREIMRICDACISASSQNYPNLVPDFQKLKKLLHQSELGHTNTDRFAVPAQEEIADQAPVSVTKGLTIRKFPSKNIVSGWSSVQNIDHAGDVMPAEEFAQVLQKFFLEDGRICLQHERENIIGKLRSYEVKKHANGRSGIYVHAEISDQNVIKAIEKRALTGFSWCFTASRKKECAKNECYNKLQPDSVIELSIVDFPCEPNAKIESIGSQA